jgi:hypothetical protein
MATVTVGLMADPGAPESLAAKVAPGLPDALAREVNAGVDWVVEASRGTLPLNPDGDVPLMESAESLRERNGWDVVVYLTDLPRFVDKRALICDVNVSRHAALVSLPALGAVRTRARVVGLAVKLIGRMAGDTAWSGDGPLEMPGISSSACRRSSESGTQSYLSAPGAAARLRLLAGMVVSNRPARLLRSLAGATAAAVATGAFGIFYASMWDLADASSVARLLLITVLAVTALTAWLIGHNRLWVAGGSDGTKWAWMDNTSTVLTVLVGVSLMYVVLFAVIFLGALAVIPAGYLQIRLGHHVSLWDYAALSWLASSLGTFAGALGSNFDTDDSVREATYSRREHERRKMAEQKE